MASREEFEYSSQAPAGYIGQFLNRGIFPYAARFLKQQFDDYGQADSSPFTYTGQRVADASTADQLSSFPLLSVFVIILIHLSFVELEHQ